MLLQGTQMHIVTFTFVCIEIVIFFYLVIYKLARPDDKTTLLNIILISLLIVYNVTGGLLPDPALPGSIFTQNVIAYGTGFITPCYFPYYVYKAFGLEKAKFHAYKGVFLFLMLPYFLFVIIYAGTHNLTTAKNLLGIPILYAVWVIISLVKAIKYKYQSNFRNKELNEELAVLLFSLSPWIGLPVITYFSLSQAAEALITNPGFLLLLALQVNRHIKQLRTEHQRLIDSELQLLDWNTNLQKEVTKRTEELEKINEQRTNTFVNLAHETKTPLTLINNYLEEYINSKGSSEELTIVKKNIDKLSADIINFFDLEKFNKGFSIYNHDQVVNFSQILNDILVLFKEYAKKRHIVLKDTIEKDVYIKADPISINRVVNNLIENAIKFSNNDCVIEISLTTLQQKIIFSIKDCGVGIPSEMHKKVFEPYYQIANQKRSIQGMGLGLPIVKKIIEDLKGEIRIESNLKREPGATIIVTLTGYEKAHTDTVAKGVTSESVLSNIEEINLQESEWHLDMETILIVEDNASMVNYLLKKLQDKYNVFTASNGSEALKKLKNVTILPNLIISDVMMDKIDGYAFAKILSENSAYNHIPIIFLSAKSTKDAKLQGLSLGAIDFIQKPFNINELLQKIESILRNVSKQKHALINTAFNNLNTPDNLRVKNSDDVFRQNCELYNLTSREKDIAKLICEGYKYKSIADTLFISERTVAKHVQNIFEKLQVSNKIELINKLEAI